MRILALIGGSGSGKSTVLTALRNHFNARVAVLSLDDYYRPKSELPVDENGETNFDLPEVINHVDLIRDIDALKRGESISLSTYTYNREVMVSEDITIDSSEWLVVEGLFVMAYPEMLSRVDVLGFIDAPEDVRLQRRIDRDGAERGYSEEEVRYQWKQHVRPADLKYIEPWKERADVIIDNQHHWEIGTQQLIDSMEKSSLS
ncbi:MAG: uridine kinase family protein [Flavobacteriales bacterium]